MNSEKKIDLIMSCFVTNQRLNGGINRCDRFDVLKFTLTTYSQIPFRKVYFFIELGEEFSNRKQELIDFINTLFPECNLVIGKRLTTQLEWKYFFDSYDITDDNYPIWLAQNDDHPFVDFNLDVLNEGLEIMYSDPTNFKVLITSHFPEGLKLGAYSKFLGISGNYLKYNHRTTESIYIYNLKYLKFFLLETPWPKEIITRTDGIFHIYHGDFDVTAFVPLRELCRHFDAYAHVGMRIDPGSEWPELNLDTSKNNFIYTEQELRKKLQVHIPYDRYPLVTVSKEIENRIVELYRPTLKKPHYTGIVLVMDPTNHVGSPGIPWLFDPNVFVMHINVWKKYMNSIPDNILTLFIRSDNSIPADTYNLDLDNNILTVYGHHAYGKNNSALSLLIAALKIIPYHFTYDYIVRATTSSFWVYERLHKMLLDLPKTGVFKGTRSFQHTTQTPNEPHVSGCGWIMSKDIGELMVENQQRLTEQDWFDDLVISKFLTDKGIQLLDTPEFVNIERHMITYQELFDIISQRDDTVFYRVKLHENRLLADEIALNILYDKHYR